MQGLSQPGLLEGEADDQVSPKPGRVPELAAGAALGDAAQLAYIGSEC